MQAKLIIIITALTLTILFAEAFKALGYYEGRVGEAIECSRNFKIK